MIISNHAELTMQAHVLRGTKQQIAENVSRIPGEVREAIVFVEEQAPAAARIPDGADIFGEMRPFMVEVADLDDSREALYSRGLGVNDPARHTLPQLRQRVLQYCTASRVERRRVELPVRR